jgi:hypothetical protein
MECEKCSNNEDFIVRTVEDYCLQCHPKTGKMLEAKSEGLTNEAKRIECMHCNHSRDITQEEQDEFWDIAH